MPIIGTTQESVLGLVDALALKAPLASPALTGTPTVPTAAGGTNTTQAASTAFVTAAVAASVTNLLEFKGNIDCSTNPNYPAGSAGDTYYVSVAGKVGGASGTDVAVGDAVVCKTDNAGGTQAAVGSSWFVLEKNLGGALLSANNLSDVASTSTALSNLGGQPLDADLTQLAALADSAGLVESITGDPRTFAVRAIGVGASTSIPTRADADARYEPIKQWMWANATRNLTDGTTALQAIFASGNDTLTLTSGVYFFRCRVLLTNMSATSGNATFDAIGGGTATITPAQMGLHGGLDAASATNSGFAGRAGNWPALTTGGNWTVAQTATECVGEFSGMFDCTVGGTIIPSVALTTAAPAVLQPGSFFIIERLGDTGATTNGGT